MKPTQTKQTPPALGVATGLDGCRWERSEWPHPKFPQDMRRGTLLPDVIWLRFHTVFRGGMMEEVTGWQSTDPNTRISPTEK
jgi:hypothetical protein